MSSCEKRFFINVSYYVVCETDSYRVFVLSLLRACSFVFVCAFASNGRCGGWGGGGEGGGVYNVMILWQA